MWDLFRRLFSILCALLAKQLNPGLDFQPPMEKDKNLFKHCHGGFLTFTVCLELSDWPEPILNFFIKAFEDMNKSQPNPYSLSYLSPVMESLPVFDL